MNISMIEAGWLTYSTPDLVIRLLEDAGRLPDVHKACEDPRGWTVDAEQVVTLPGVRVDRALLREMSYRDVRRLQRETRAALRRLESLLSPQL